MDHFTDAKEIWREVERLVAEISQNAKSQTPPSSFFRYLLQNTTRVLRANGAAIWFMCSGELRAEYQTEGFSLILESSAARQLHGGFCQSVIDDAQAKSFPALSNGGATSLESSPGTGCSLLAVPLVVDESPVGAVEFVLPNERDSEATAGNLRLLQVVADLAGDYLRRREIRRLHDIESDMVQCEQLARRLHAQLDIKSTAFEIVNELRRFVDSDRVSLLISHGDRFRLAAISGVDTVAPRSNAVRAMERLAMAIDQSGQDCWFRGTGQEGTLPAEQGVLPVELTAYLETTPARQVTSLRLQAARPEVRSSRQGTVGVLVSEQFSEDLSPSGEMRLRSAAQHARLALSNAVQHDCIPLGAVQRSAGMLLKSTWTSWKKTVVVALLLCAAVCLLFIPADFDVYGEGMLQPKIQREIFAPEDGQLIDLRVRHEADVQQGDVVLVLDSPQLHLELERVEGECETTRKRIMAIRAARVQLDVVSPGAELRLQQLTAELEELKQLQSSQQKQLAMLGEDRQKLQVKSPLTGRVITWDAKRRLENRPVQRGQALLTVADVNGPWEAEVWIPDYKSRWVQEYAMAHGFAEVSVSLTADRSVTDRGRLEDFPRRPELNDDGQPGIWLTVNVDRDTFANPRPGASVSAKIHCGTRPLGYVWFADVVDRIRGWWYF